MLCASRGEKGDTGDGLKILGHYDTLQALQQAVPNPAAGDAYSIGTSAPYSVYIWDAKNSVWVDNGQIQGAQGAAGEIAIGTVETGAPGTDASVTNVGTAESAILDFVIPQGYTGASGSTWYSGAGINVGTDTRANPRLWPPFWRMPRRNSLRPSTRTDTSEAARCTAARATRAYTAQNSRRRFERTSRRQGSRALLSSAKATPAGSPSRPRSAQARRTTSMRRIISRLTVCGELGIRRGAVYIHWGLHTPFADPKRAGVAGYLVRQVPAFDAAPWRCQFSAVFSAKKNKHFVLVLSKWYTLRGSNPGHPD